MLFGKTLIVLILFKNINSLISKYINVTYFYTGRLI